MVAYLFSEKMVSLENQFKDWERYDLIRKMEKGDSFKDLRQFEQKPLFGEKSCFIEEK